MKKKFWMIIMIILVILLIPRYNSQRTKAHQGHRLPHRKVNTDSDELEFPYPGKWLLMNIKPFGKLRKQYAVNSRFIATGYNYNCYMPAQARHG